jgi:hypothetical protein
VKTHYNLEILEYYKIANNNGSLSNRIGEDQFPASKMKWGIFLGTDTVNTPQ